MSDESDDQWIVRSYELINITQVSHMLAVYAEQHPDHPGKYRLYSNPIHFVGVAIVTVRTFQRDADGSVHEIDTLRDENVAVGIELSAGFFEVCNEADNFAGLMREGDNIEHASGCLNRRKYPLFKPDLKPF